MRRRARYGKRRFWQCCFASVRSPFSTPTASVISASRTSCRAARTSARRNSSSSARTALTSIVPDSASCSWPLRPRHRARLHLPRARDPRQANTSGRRRRRAWSRPRERHRVERLIALSGRQPEPWLPPRVIACESGSDFDPTPIRLLSDWNNSEIGGSRRISAASNGDLLFF